MNYSEIIVKNQQEFLKYLKSNFPVFNKSNLFLRDLEYGVINFLKEKNKKMNYAKGEKITTEVIESLEKENILKKIDNQTWMLNYPEFTTPKVEKNTPVVTPKVR
jgi:hypothetical protein